MEKITTVIIGLGRIASLLEDDELREKPCTHAGAVAAGPDCVLAAGCDLDGERRRLFAERWNCPVYEDAEAMLKARRPALVHIATHPDSHAEYCELAAAFGARAVVCEKPLADTLRKARKIAALHTSGKIRILANHERRYQADYVRAKAILDEGRLGPLLGVKAALYMGRGRRLLDVLWHDGTHLADAMMFLTGGTMRHRKIWGAPLGAREGAAFLAGRIEGEGGTKHAAGGIPFLVELGAGRDHLVFELEFSTQRGRLRIGNGIFEVWESGPSPYAEQFRSLKKVEEGFAGPTGYFANMVQDAAACVRDPSRRPRSTALDGLKVIEYLNAVSPWRKK